MITTLVPSQRGSAAAEREPAANAFPLPPPGYAIAALPDGRFLPMSVLLLSLDGVTESSLSLCGLHWQNEIIPPAAGNWPRTGPIICRTYAAAHGFCERCAETPRLLLDSERLAAEAECYPDRNIWYRGESERLLREADYCWPNDMNGPFFIVTTTSGISAWIHAYSLSVLTMHLHIQAANFDEMWEVLYAAIVAASGNEANPP